MNRKVPRIRKKTKEKHNDRNSSSVNYHHSHHSTLEPPFEGKKLVWFMTPTMQKYKSTDEVFLFFEITNDLSRACFRWENTIRYNQLMAPDMKSMIFSITVESSIVPASFVEESVVSTKTDLSPWLQQASYIKKGILVPTSRDDLTTYLGCFPYILPSTPPDCVGQTYHKTFSSHPLHFCLMKSKEREEIHIFNIIMELSRPWIQSRAQWATPTSYLHPKPQWQEHFDEANNKNLFVTLPLEENEENDIPF
jgi:hypothetical protein